MTDTMTDTMTNPPTNPPTEPSASDLMAQRLDKIEGALGKIASQHQSFSQQNAVAQEQSRVAAARKAAADKVAEAERAYRAAREEGDLDAELKATRALSRAEADSAQLEREIAAREAAAKSQPAPRQINTTELDKFKSRNQWFGTNQDATNFALQIDDGVQRQGYTKGSPAYFAEIERQVAARFPDLKASSGPPVAGGSRGAPAAEGSVRFSHDQLDSFRAMGFNVDDPETLKSLAVGRQAAAERGFVPEKPTGLAGRVMLRR